MGRRPIDTVAPDAAASTRGVVRDAVLRVHDANFELKAGRIDVQAGLARVVWGRLDEIQPGDVINPLDVSKFFFEGRGAARLPVALVRGRVFLTDSTSVEGVYVPIFRRGRFDQLDEPTSPFRPASQPGDGLVVCLALTCPVLPPAIVDDEPPVTAESAQGGVRFSASTGRVDWSVSAFRGFEAFPIYAIGTARPGERVVIRGTHPRFTMIGGDFETVRGQWGVRGEVAAFVDDNFQSPALAAVSGSSFDAGAGVDRKAGSYRVSATALYHRERYERSIAEPAGSASERDDLSLILSVDRSFGRERYQVRGFGVANMSEGSGFTRGIATAKLRDNVDLEGSVGWFIGRGADLVGRFADSDFAYARLKYYF